MHPEVFSIFGLTIQSYGVCMAVGFALAYYFMLRRGKIVLNMTSDQFSTILMVVIMGGIIGARFTYVVQNWNEFSANPLDVFKVWNGGLVFYGGFLGALTTSFVYSKFNKMSILKLGDLLLSVLPLGHAFGRIGCFMKGCCFGARTDAPYGYAFPKNSPAWFQQVNSGEIFITASQALPVIPIQLIEATCNFILFVILYFLIYPKTSKLPGLLCGIYLISYACIRFFLEIFRDDPRGSLILGFSFSQFTSICLLLFGTFLVIIANLKNKTVTK